MFFDFFILNFYLNYIIQNNRIIFQFKEIRNMKK